MTKLKQTKQYKNKTKKNAEPKSCKCFLVSALPLMSFPKVKPSAEGRGNLQALFMFDEGESGIGPRQY